MCPLHHLVLLFDSASLLAADSVAEAEPQRQLEWRVQTPQEAAARQNTSHHQLFVRHYAACPRIT